MPAGYRWALPAFTALLISACSVATLLDTPVGPTNLDGAIISETEITLEWHDNSDNEIGFVMEIGLSSDDFESVVNIDPDVTNAVVGELTPDSEYYFRIYAYNLGGQSDYSNVSMFHTVSDTNHDVPPDAPSSLVAEATAPNTIVLSWLDSSSNEEGFKLYRGIGTSDPQNFSLIAEIDANITEYTDTGSEASDLPPVTNIFYYITAHNRSGESEPTEIIYVVTQSISPLSPPTGLTATKGTVEDEISLNWNTVDGAIAFNIYSSDAADGIYAYQGFTIATTLTIDSTGTTEHFFFRVSAYDKNSDETDRSDYDEGWAATQGETTTSELPTAASGLTARQFSDADDESAREEADDADESISEIEPNTAVTLTWIDNSQNEEEYVVERSAISNDDGFTPLATMSFNIAEYIDFDMQPGARYWYRVRAKNSFGESANSNVVSVKIKSHGPPRGADKKESPRMPGWVHSAPFSDYFSVTDAIPGGSGKKYVGLGNLFKNPELLAALVSEMLEADQPDSVTLYLGPYLKNNQNDKIPGQDHAVILRTFLSSDGFLHLKTNRGIVRSKRYKSGVWTKIGFNNIDWSDNTLDLYVNNQLMASGINLSIQNLPILAF